MMWWGNCVLFIVLFHGVLCQDTNPEWLEPPVSTVSTPEPTTTTFRIPTTTTTETSTTDPPITTTKIPATRIPTTTERPITDPPVTTTRIPTTTERPITDPPVTTTRIPATETRIPTTTRYPPTRYPPTRYPATRYPPTVTHTPPLVTYPHPSPTTKPTPTTPMGCIISLSKPVVQYYSVFGMIYNTVSQCCTLCCPTKYIGKFYCRRISFKYCDYESEYDY